MKKSLVSKFLLGVMSLSMAFSVVGNNAAKAEGFDSVTNLVCKVPYNQLISNSDFSSEEAAKSIRAIINNFPNVDSKIAAIVLRNFFAHFPNLINIGTEEDGLFMNTLFWFVVEDDVDMVKWMIELWVERTESGEYIENGYDMFRVAVENKKIKVAKYLAAHGYNKNYVIKPMDPAQVNPPKADKPAPKAAPASKSKTGLKARFRKMLGCFGSK